MKISTKKTFIDFYVGFFGNQDKYSSVNFSKKKICLFHSSIYLLINNKIHCQCYYVLNLKKKNKMTVKSDHKSR